VEHKALFPGADRFNGTESLLGYGNYKILSEMASAGCVGELSKFMTKKTKVITEIAALEAGLEAVLKELRGLTKLAKQARRTKVMRTEIPKRKLKPLSLRIIP
jgi:hypothetical protein